MKKKLQTTTESNIERFSPSPKTGLLVEQVEKRITEGLTNSVEKKYSKSYIGIICENVFTFFNLLGLIVCIALILTGASISQFFFVLIYIANILIGITQSVRAKISIDKLSLMSSKNSKVIRNSLVTEILSKDIVLDDIIVLSIGNQVPTDCIIIDGKTEVNESLLTGESVAVKKKVGDELLAGSFITSGSCIVRAEKVGKDNYVQTLSAKAKKYKRPHSELMGALSLIIKVVGVIIIPIAGIFIMKSMLMGSDIANAVQGTSTVVIGMIPSGIFLLTSMALAVGVIKLARHNTLVQDLYSLEMLARVDTICFDKTGTITDGRMNVKEVLVLEKDPKYSVDEIMGAMLGCLRDNNQTAIALYNYFGQNGILHATEVMPFNSTRKLSAVTFNNAGTYAFGAPEFVLSALNYKHIEQLVKQYASMGTRVLLLAHSHNNISKDKIPTDFEPIALILITDNIREDAIETVKWFKENGVQIKVISGDNPITVSEVSKRVGIEGAEKYISLEGMTENEVIAVANKYTVFGRVSPEQKAILIKSMKAAGHVTAMTGDGVNDILALKEADCAISVASGSDAARNISHLVLMDNNFNSMPQVVLEGRRVINNVQSSASLYLMKTIFTMLLAVIVLCTNMPNYPFKLSNMILLETFVIGIPSFFLSLQKNDSLVSGKFINQVITKSLPSAILMVLSAVLVGGFRFFLGNGIHFTITDDIYVTMGVYAITYSGLINLFNICKPFNNFRKVLFSLCFTVVVLISAFAIGNGIPILGLEKMSPVIEYWQHILIVVTIILFDIILCAKITDMCSKINVPLLKKIDKKQ